MKTKTLGESTTNKQFDDWHEFKPVFVPMLQKPVSVTVEGDDIDPPEIDSVMTHILSLGEEERAVLQGHLFTNYMSTVDAVGLEDAGCDIASEIDVWKHLDLSELLIMRRQYGNKKIYAQFAGSCDWEEEHGLTVSYLEGRILARVSQHDGHLTYCDAYAVPESDDKIDG